MDKDLTSASKGDASPLTTSTESESFDTWTVISGKARNISSETIRFTPLTPEKSDDDEEIAVDAVHVEVFKAPEDQNSNRYNDIDDLSDGISIISESESAGRLSPHPELRKHLSELNMRFINPTESALSSPEEAKQPPLSYEASSERSSDDFHRVEPLVENNRKTQRTSTQIVDSTSFQSTCRCGMKGLFYVGALLAVLAFFSKLKYDSWESVIGTTTHVLTQKISDLELKNNLMRAEIDILSKQVNYLTTLSEAQKYSQNKPNKPSKPQPRDDKFKAWSGNGNTIDQVEITSEDLKKPFKCEGNTNFDIAGMCIELPLSAEEVADSIGEKIQTVIDDNNIFVNLETVADQIAKLVDNPFGEPVPTPKVGVPPKRADPIVSHEPADSYTPHEHKPDKKYEKRENYKKHSNTKNYNSGESKENIKPRRDRSSENSKESGERYKKSKDYKKYDKRSASEYENAKREADGQWHEKMMQHRETARKYNEKHRHDKNWYIERGDSREQARVTEQNYNPIEQ